MPNPDGTDRDQQDRSVETTAERTGSPPPPGEDDPVTDAIGRTEPDAPETGERRYTAPGFDAGSTQVIDRVPDPPTELISVGEGAGDVAGEDIGEGAESPTASDPAAPGSGEPRGAAPQAIPARAPNRRRRRALAAAVAVALLAAVAVGLVQWDKARKASQLQKVREAITAFDEALAEGDLSTLRAITCGQTQENYLTYDDQEWTETYSKVMAAGQYPVVASIDEVVIDGDRAEANVTSYLAFDPDTRSTRSFDLQRRDGQWKICQAS